MCRFFYLLLAIDAKKGRTKNIIKRIKPTSTRKVQRAANGFDALAIETTRAKRHHALIKNENFESDEGIQ